MSSAPFRTILAFACALVGARSMAGQEPPSRMPTVQGVVYDTISGRPLQAAVVRVVESGASTLTDERGRYAVAVAGGPIRLEVRRIGYQPASVALTVTAPLIGYNVYLHPI